MGSPLSIVIELQSEIAAIASDLRTFLAFIINSTLMSCEYLFQDTFRNLHLFWKREYKKMKVLEIISYTQIKNQKLVNLD